METSSITDKKNTFLIPYLDSQVKLSGNFDSGNLNDASLNMQTNEIQLTFGRDKDIKPSSKCWFYFSVQAKSAYLPVKLHLLKTNSLNIVSKIYDLYRPVVKVEGGQWERYPSPIQFQTSPQNDTNFRLTIDIYNSKKVYVALCYPWSFSQNQEYLCELGLELAKRKDIYYNKQTLIYSPQKRPLHLLALSSSQVKNQDPEDYIEHLFPNRQNQHHFKKINKPMILITSRVHPGEIGSSYSLLGMIQFLIGGTDEANKILNQFYFLIIPMLNPDGVFQGNNRMDCYGQNLNRFYHLPELQKQPTCFAVKSLVQNTRHQIYAFFDLHGHANKKSCFLFGNSITNNRLQVESVLFAKYLSTICDYIEFKSCNFSKKQMSSKDKGQDLSKQGCARVVVHRWTNSPYCYTLQTGLHKNVKVDQKGIQRYGDKFYNPQIYKQVGWKMIASLFRILKKSKQIDQMRKSVSQYCAKLQKLNNPKKPKKQSAKQIKQPLQKQALNKDVVQSTKQIKMKSNSQPAIVEIKKNHSTSEKQNEKFRSIEATLKMNKMNLLNYETQVDDE